MQGIILVAAGGAIGSVIRYLIGVALGQGMPGSYPLATLVVNLVGCFAFGVVSGRLVELESAGEPWRLLIVVGFLGGFTTFSAFGGELAAGLRAGAFLQTSLHLGLHIIGGISMVIAGHLVQERIG